MPTTATVDGIELRVKYASDGASDSIARLREELRALAGVLPSVVSGLGDTAKGFSKIASAASKAAKAVSAYRAAMSGMNVGSGTASEAQPKDNRAPFMAPALQKNVFQDKVSGITGFKDIVDVPYEEVAEGMKEVNDALAEVGDSVRNSIPISKQFADAWNKAAQSVSSVWGGLFKSIGRIAVYRMIRGGIKMVTSATKEGIENISQYSKAVGNLGSYGSNANAAMSEFATLGLYVKNSLGAALIPVLHSLVPAAQAVANAFAAASNAVARFLSIIGGKATFTKAKMYAVDYADSLKKGAGGASKAVKEFETGIDELNVLSDKAGSGGGGGADAMDFSQMFEEAATGIKTGDFLSDLAITIDDVLFKWHDLTGEQIAEKLVAGLLGLAMGVAGFLITGSFAGGLMFALAGVGLGLIVDTLVFDHDGHLSGSEVAQMLTGVIAGLIGFAAGFTLTGGNLAGGLIGFTVAAGITMAVNGLWLKQGTASLSSTIIIEALSAMAGGIIGGFVLGGPGGAAIGATIGLGLSLVVTGLTWFQNKKLIDAFNETEFGKHTAELRERMEQLITESMDLRVQVKNITGEIDPGTIALLEQAKKLVDEIFTLNDKENLTSDEAAHLKTLIEEVNGLGLGELRLEFDETTGKVKETKQEIEAVIEALKKEMTIQALKESIVAALKAQGDQQYKYNEALKAAAEATEDVKAKEQELEEAQKALNDAVENGAKAAETAGDAWVSRTKGAITGASDEYYKLSERVKAANTALEQSQTTKQTAITALNEISGGLVETKDKVSFLEEQLESYMKTSDDAATETKKSMTDIKTDYEDATDAMKTAVETKVTGQGGIFEGIKTGVGEVAETTKDAMLGDDGVKHSITTGFEESTGPVDVSMKSMWTSVDEYGTKIIEKFREMKDAIKELNSMELDVEGESFRFGDAYGNGFPQYASGGFPETGSLFWANENGPEMVGTMGNQTAVANSDQIVAGITNGVAQGMRGANSDVVSTLYGVISAIENKNLSISDKDIGYANARFTTSRGVNVNRGAFADAY